MDETPTIAEEVEEEGVTKINLVTCDISSVLVRFTKGLLMNSVAVAPWEAPELVSEGTLTAFFTNDGCKQEPAPAVCVGRPLFVATEQLAEILEP